MQWRAWQELRTGAVIRPDVQGWTWASPYQPWTFAGVQVALQAWATGGRVLSLGTDWQAAWILLARERVQAVSATPTYLDLWLQEEPHPQLPWEPRQITLGGEPLRPAVGTRLRQRFPRCRFTVIYAMAEWGVLLKTGRLDGWYERDSLDRAGAWRVVEGTLEIQRGDCWWRTGDRLEVQGNLVRVPGRGDQVANVAGTKVSLIEVAELAEQVPGVQRALALAEANPVTGQIITLKYAVARGFVSDQVLLELQRVLRERLRKEAWPRRWVLDEVGPGPNAKRAVA
jgi:acyl-CoA synthetase (AMP-forming)/AMP-acid ligase II